MRRRTLLRRSAALGAIAMAGCMGDGDDNPGDGTPTGGDTGSPTDDPTDTPSGITGFGDTGIETTDTGCAEGEDAESASVTFDADAVSIAVDGVVEASNPCHVASLEGTKYDSEEMVLSVTIAAKPRDAEEACMECIGGIEYEATLDLEGGLPATVVVRHGTGSDATEVARVDQD